MPTTSLATEHKDNHTAMMANISTLSQAHKHYGHLCLSGLKQLAKLGKLNNVSAAEWKNGLPLCATCKLGKMTALPYPKKARRRATRKMELIHSDVIGKMTVPSLGTCYIITFIDDFSRIARVYLMSKKSEALSMFKCYISDMAAPEGLHVGVFENRWWEGVYMQ